MREFRWDIADRISGLKDDVGTLTDRQVVIRVAALLATSGEAHSYTDLAASAITAHKLPVTLRWLADGLFVTDGNDATARLIGSTVLACAERLSSVTGTTPASSMTPAAPAEMNGRRARKAFSDYALPMRTTW